MKKTKIISVVGARPNFMKIAPFCHEIAKHSDLFDHLLVNTGQHYDMSMSGNFFNSLQIPEPEINLEVGSGSHAAQTANVMIKFENVCVKYKPDWIVVVGDVNSTMACTLVASKMGIKIAHIEAGLRSFDRSMPEEINRIVTDSLADLLLTPSMDANENLIREGISKEKIRFVGNIMIDTLVKNIDIAEAKKTFKQWNFRPKEYIFVTLHRPSNVDNEISLSCIVNIFLELTDNFSVIFPVHPRTKKSLEKYNLCENLINNNKIALCGPLDYHDCICLIKNAKFVLTDSGGMQEETTYLNIPCLTLRPNTERPITIEEGSNRLTSVTTLHSDIKVVLRGDNKKIRIPEYWEGNTAKRVVEAVISVTDS